MHTRRYTLFAVALAGLACLLLAAASTSQALTDKQKVGRSLFFDTNLSEPAGQACAACHGRNVGWTGPDASVDRAGAVYPGAFPGRFGNRKPPAAAYAGRSPRLHYDVAAASWVGGMFWDGRKTGYVLGDPLTEQAQGPFLNPLEQNNADAAAVVAKVKASSYAPLFTDFSYDNLGIPRNPLNPFYSEPAYNPLGTAWVDKGLGGYLETTGYYDASVYAPELGKFKVPTLRNVDRRPNPSFVKAYGHNGYFKSLKELSLIH